MKCLFDGIVKIALCCRPPRGGRGLKFSRNAVVRRQLVSPPSRGAWIEIFLSYSSVRCRARRPPRGGRGLKLFLRRTKSKPVKVAPLAGGVD